MEDYEKKYKETLNRAKKWYYAPNADKMPTYANRIIKEIFPELKESEDEKIRKALVRFHKSTIDIDGIKGANILAWIEKQGQTFTKKDVDDAYLKGICDAKHELEKQGEQKPAVTDFNAKDWYVSKVDGKIHDMTYNPTDKVEPKFHEGEWIVWKNKCYKVNYNGCGYELIDQNDLSTSLEYGTVDTSARLYDVTKDAKDGDVLISQYGNPLIYNGNYNSLNIGAYCGITCDDNKFKVAEEKCHWTENVEIKPATKEQRDLLFKKMKEAGYEWDDDKKELKKIHVIDEDKAEMDYCFTKMMAGEKVSPAWSEEDKNFMYDTLSNLTELKDRYGEGYGNVGKCITWLKSLKDRIGG